MAKLVLSSGGAAVNAYFVDRQRLAIGRATGSDIVIDDAAVSAEHAAIVAVGEDHIIEDLGSAGGTFVNGERVERRILQHRDVVEFGAFSLCYLNSKTAATQSDFDRTMLIAALPEADDAGSAPPDAAALLPARDVAVRFPNGYLEPESAAGNVALDRVVTLVGTPGEQLAVIARRPQGYFLTHVEGSQASLNGQPTGTKPQMLRDGDVIEAAGRRWQFHLEPIGTADEVATLT